MWCLLSIINLTSTTSADAQRWEVTDTDPAWPWWRKPLIQRWGDYSTTTTLKACLMMCPCRGHQENLCTEKKASLGMMEFERKQLWSRMTKIHGVHV